MKILPVEAELFHAKRHKYGRTDGQSVRGRQTRLSEWSLSTILRKRFKAERIMNLMVKTV